MKKLIAVCILTMLALLLAACSGASGPAALPSAAAILKGKIITPNGESRLVAGDGTGGLYTVSTKTALFDANGKPAEISALKAGQTVEIGYSGNVLESYPMLLGSPAYIKITSDGEDLVGFYTAVLEDLWKEDDGLNPDKGVLAFDLSGVANLTAAEKSALVYTVSNAHGLEGIAGTFDELVEQGYIHKNELLFENGMLYAVKVTAKTDGGFAFEASKWRSGTGALYYQNCKAQKSGGQWRYTVGSVAIS